MSKTKNKKINWRAFISVYMAISFVIMILSGLILFVSPPGRIAHWSYWAMLGLTKSEWQAIHTIFTFLFIGVGVLHLIYNWKPMLNYFRTKSNGARKIRRELILASIFTIIVFLGTYNTIPPFETIMNVGEAITDSWSNETNEPPIPHAERLTISEFAKEVDIPLKRLERILNKNGYMVKDTTVTIEAVAIKYNITPSEIYQIIKLSEPKSKNIGSNVNKSGSGFGQKLLSEILSENNISWEDGIELLKKNGILVESDVKLKDIASNNNLIPSDIIKALNIN